MSINVEYIISEVEQKKTLKMMIILTRVNLLCLTKDYVEYAFKRVIDFFLYKEEYETCARLKKIQDKYYVDLKKQEQNINK